MNKIFISIAAYEDACLVPTIQDAIAKADNPYEITIAVGLQYESEPDLSFVNNLKILRYGVGDDRPGVSRVRYDLSNLITDEQYFLQIDSHSRFDFGWDTKLINLLNNAYTYGNTKDIILSGNPGSMVGDDIHLGTDESRTRSYRKLSFDPNLEMFAEKLDNVNEHFHPHYTDPYFKIYYISAGFVFCDTRYIKEVGLDPYSRSLKEEPYFAFRALISGWDIYQARYSFPIGHDEAWQKELNGNKYEELYYVNGERTPGKIFNGKHNNDNIGIATAYMMSLAMIYNDYSYYAIKNAKRTPEEVWGMSGLTEQYLYYKDKYDHLIRNIRFDK